MSVPKIPSVKYPETCIGYGATRGKCQNKAGSSHSNHWCQACDDVRLATITKQFEEIEASFAEKGAGE